MLGNLTDTTSPALYVLVDALGDSGLLLGMVPCTSASGAITVPVPGRRA